MAESVAYLRTPKAIRERCNAVLALGLEGKLAYFSVDLASVERVADYVTAVTRAEYPDLKVPIHGRFRHFEVGGVDRIAEIEIADPKERARALIDLVVPSVLLDAGAGSAWKYVEKGKVFSRSEGLAVASFHMFANKKVDLSKVTVEDVAREFQVGKDNPLVGLEGRTGLVRALGAAIAARPDLFPGNRIGGIVDVLPANVPAERVLSLILEGLGPIWPGRVEIDGVNLGDVWPHPQVGLVPFHKLSQWLTYSLVEPLAVAGIEVTDLDALTGLPEYRNGGLLIDLGALVPKHPLARYRPGDAFVVEWRALTVALLDRVADGVRRALNLPNLPLANVLQGGTWTAGRKIAAEKRPGGGPPVDIDSDGTVF
ncbi:MAG: URC4/urg3 family protein [Polyangiales bacterium]